MAKALVTFRATPGFKTTSYVGPRALRVQVIFPDTGELSLPADDPRVDVLDAFCVSAAHDITNQPKEPKK